MSGDAGVPWLSLVRFHKEVVKRAEEGFFSLSVVSAQSDRWTSLKGFDPATLSGPWEVSLERVTSRDFLHAFAAGRHAETYIGGPGFYGFFKDKQGNWTPQWRPLLYRQVTLEPHDDGTLFIAPAQGVWELSPLVAKLIDQHAVAADSSALVTQVLEDAEVRHDTSAVTYGEAVKQAFLTLLPALEEDLAKTARVRETPSPWVLFAPVGTMGPMLQHLMKDYERLESRLAQNASDIGGFRVFNEWVGEADDAEAVSDILPIVPLTNSQYRAVSMALSGAPLTVVSGPPGCGKSQVVVSLLLNAWATGLTVLFASNNNRAVDVVRERLEPFEDQVPIIARAGAAGFNHVPEVLSRVSAVLAAAARGDIQPDGQHDTRSTLERQRRQIQDQIDTRVPQRADEALTSALTGYATYRKTVNQLRTQGERVSHAIVSLGYPAERASNAAAWAQELSQWVDAGCQAHKSVEEGERERARFREQALAYTSRRNELSGQMRLAPGSQQDWTWLLTGAAPELLEGAWSGLSSHLLDTSLDRNLEAFEWKAQWAQWSDSRHAASERDALRELATDVRAAVAELESKIRVIKAKHGEVEQAEHRASALGIARAPRTDIAALDDWLTHYGGLLSIVPSWKNRLPFSTVRRELRTLRRLEAEIRPSFPVAIFRAVEDVSGDGRERLATVFEAARDWLLRLEEWESLTSVRESVESCFAALRGRAAALRLQGIPPGSDIEHWRALPGTIDERARLADEALSGWERRERRERAWASLVSAARPVLECASGQPFWQAWASGEGRAFVEAVSSLCRQPQSVDVISARSFCHSELVPALLERWREARDVERQRRDVTQRASNIPSAQTVYERWAAERPSWLLGNVATPSSFPVVEGPLHEHLGTLRAVSAQWAEFTGLLAPTLQASALSELQWATKQLEAARDVVPAGLEHDAIARVIGRVLADPESDWDTAALRRVFADFSPARLRATLARIDSDLGKIAFAEATAGWVKRLKGSQPTLRAVNEVRQHLLRQRRLEEPQYGTFRSALPAVPVWITTAQSTQAVPLEPDLFDLVVVDEASQCTLTNLLPLLYRGRRLVVIGDPRQLSAIPTIPASEENVLARKFKVEAWMTTLGHCTNNVYDTAEQALPHRGADVTMLTDHFRSHPLIIGFSNREVYQRQLRIQLDPTRVRHLERFGGGVHVRAVTGHAERGDNGRSWRNRDEAKAVVELIREFREIDVRSLTLGVVTPFRAQDDLISGMLEQEGLLQNVTVGTVDRFQGDERDVVFFSPVLSPGVPDATATWVEQPMNRINVAVTRARDAFFLVGHLDHCARQPGILGKLVRYCRDADLLRRTSAEELQLFSWMATRGWSPEVHVRLGDLEVDFVLHNGAVHLVIEVDGGQHTDTVQSDGARDAFLNARGYKVVRVSTRSVRETPSAVLEQIAEALEIESAATGHGAQ